LGKEGKKKNDRVSVRSHNTKCEGRGYKDVYCKLLKNREVGGKGVRKSKGRGIH
jgi:hypothetical protein